MDAHMIWQGYGGDIPIDLTFWPEGLDDCDTAILACATLTEYVHAAQRACKTSFPVVFLDRNLHVDPDLMRRYILDAISMLPEDIHTVLVAMGFCGGSWKEVTCPRRLVIPRIDDCVSMVMTTSDELCVDTKEKGHMYEFGAEYDGFSIGGIYDDLVKEYGPEKGKMVFDMMFAGYCNVDIVETGIYDCHEPEFVANALRDAALIDGELAFVPGSNHLLEKLVSRQWDEQFLVVEPGTTITQDMIFGSWRKRRNRRLTC